MKKYDHTLGDNRSRLVDRHEQFVRNLGMGTNRAVQEGRKLKNVLSDKKEHENSYWDKK